MENIPTKSSAAAIGTGLSALLVGAMVVGVAPASQAVSVTPQPMGELVGTNAVRTTSDFSSTVRPSKVVPMKNFEVTARYGSTSGVHSGRGHAGIDLAAPHGQKIVSATNGKVIEAGPAGAYGNLVKIKTSNGKKVLYAHLSQITVKKGDKVKAGKRIGREGSTGRSTGPHLHFEVWNKKGDPIDPVKFLGITYKKLAKAGR